MPDASSTLEEVKISELEPAAQAHATDQLEASQLADPGFVSRSITLDQVATYIAMSEQITTVIDDAIAEIPPPPPNDWDSITGKPATFPPATHTHPESDITNLVADLALKAPLASPTFTGNPTAPTPATDDNDTSIATTEFVTTAIAAIPPTGSLLTGFWNYNAAALVPPPANGRVRLSVAWPPTLGASVHLYIASTDIDGLVYTWGLGPNVNDLLVVRSASGARLDGTVTAKSIGASWLDVTITVTAVSGNWVNNSRTQIAAVQFIAHYLPLAGGTLTGPLAGTTAAFSGQITAATPTYPDNDTSVATTAYVTAALAAGASISVGTTPPGSPSANQLWWNTDASVGGGTLYIYYDSFWVPASPGVGSGAVVQTVSFQTGALASGTTVIPNDDTIPQITEGNEYMTLAITPKSASSTLLIDVSGVWSHGNAANPNPFIVALFQDATANALAAAAHRLPGVAAAAQISLRHKMTSGTTSATTFRVRAGSSNAGSTTFNGENVARLLGGVMASSIVIQEVL